jgi:hypothetical protein
VPRKSLDHYQSAPAGPLEHKDAFSENNSKNKIKYGSEIKQITMHSCKKKQTIGTRSCKKEKKN